MKHGIKFYSVHDMSSGMFLRESEAFFQNWDENTNNPDINTILELYNIKQYFDADMRLEQWTEDQVAEYKKKCKLIPGIVGRFFDMVSLDELKLLYEATDLNYKDDFWQVICDNKVFQCIDPKILQTLMDSDEKIVWRILRQRVLAKYFGQVISDHLIHNCNTAEKLISHFLAAHDCDNNRLFFPVEFTQEKRDKVLADYVEREDANINYLKLLEQAQSSKEFPVSDKLKLRARKKKEKLQNELFFGKPEITYGAEVTFKSIPDGSIEESVHNGVASCAYSHEWVEDKQDYPTLLNNFIYLFNFVDRYFRCTFVSLKSEMGVFESNLGVKGKKDYEKGIGFEAKQILSTVQMAAYTDELQRLNIQIEELFKWFFEVYLKDEFGAKGFTYSPPSPGTTEVEKCKLLAIAIDGVLKQYRLFCEEGNVDHELLEISSGHVVFRELPSMMAEKYVYAKSEMLKSEMNLLFSDQSMMSYTEKTGSKYQTLPQLLMSETIKRENFASFQQWDLNWLIKRDAVWVADDGQLHINKMRAAVLKDLFDNEVICPTYYGRQLQQQVEILVNAEDMCYEDTLFSRPEQDYLNYILNKSEFSNGLDLRNKYSHDTCSLDERTQRQDYLILKKIMAFIIIKINEEFCRKNLI